MYMDSIKLGTIGSGMIVRKILNSVMATDGISPEAVYSRTEKNGLKLADDYKCGKVYTDMSLFLNDPDINTVYIASPNILHYEQSKAALIAGKNVICEKPFVTRKCEAEELAELAEEKGLFLAEAAPTAYLPNFQILKKELPEIGKVRLIMSNYSQYSSRFDALLRGEKPNIFNPQFAGGCLMDINYYNILLNVLLFGVPKSAEYHYNRHLDMADISGTVILDYDGFISSNCGAKDTWGVNYFQIEGDNGYIYIDGGSNGIQSVRVVTRDSDKTFNEQSNLDRRYFEIQALTRLMLARNYSTIRARMNTTIQTVGLIEQLRLRSGLIFPTDK